MEDNRKEVDPSGQELIEGSTIAEGISSVNHTTPSSSAPPIEGRVQLSDDQRRESKKAADKIYNEKRKRNNAELKRELQKLEDDFGELKSKKKTLKRERDQRKELVDEENKKILSQLVDTYAGENTGVPQAGISKIGEISTGQDAFNEPGEVNQAPITSNVDTIFGENASMNLLTLPRSPDQPAGSSRLARKRIADKKCREKRKRMLDEDEARTKELKEKNAKLETDNAVLEAETILLQNQLDQLRNISEKVAFKDARRSAKLEKLLDLFENYDQGSTLNTQQKDTGRHEVEKVIADCDELMKTNARLTGKLDQFVDCLGGLLQVVQKQNAWNNMHQQLLEAGAGFVTGETGFHDHSPPIYQPRATMDPRGLVIEESLSQSHQAEREHLSWSITPGCAFDTWEARAPVHHQPDPSGTTIRPGGSME